MMPLLCVYADFVGHPRRRRRRRRHARPRARAVPERRPGRRHAHRLRASASSRASIFGVLIAIAGLPARHAKRATAPSAVGRRRHLRRGHRHRPDHRRRRHLRGAVPHPGDLMSCSRRAHRRRARAAHRGARPRPWPSATFVLMRDLDFTVRRGDIFVIMGGSGCGKSTLLRHMIGLIEPAQGEVFYGEQSFTARRGRAAPANAAALRRALPERRAVELDDAGRERRAAARGVHAS